MVGRLGPLHEEGQAVGLYWRWAYRVVGLGPKATVLTIGGGGGGGPYSNLGGDKFVGNGLSPMTPIFSSVFVSFKVILFIFNFF